MSLLVIALNFTRVVTVLDVPLCIPVPSVRVPTERVFVLFVPIQSSYHEPLPMPSPPGPNPHLPTPIKFNRLLYLLSRYNSSTVMFLSNWFTRGFPLHFQGICESSQAKNLLSAIKNPTIVDAKTAKELAAGPLTGPFLSPPISPFIVSPLGVVPKKSPGEFRLIQGASVKDGISHENSTV